MKNKLSTIWSILSYPTLFIVIQLGVSLIWVIDAAFRHFFVAGLVGYDASEVDAVAVLADINLAMIALVSGALTLFVMWLILRKEWRAQRFWKASGISVRGVILCALIGFSMNFFLSMLIALTEIYTLFPEHEVLMEALSTGPLIIRILSIAVMASVVEEVVFRGIILKRLMDMSISFHIANVIQAFLFGLIHFNVLQSAYAFLIGIAFGLVYAKFKTIWAPIIMHTTFNLLSVLAAYFVGNYYGYNYYTDIYDSPEGSLAIMVISFAITALLGTGIYKMQVTDDTILEEE